MIDQLELQSGYARRWLLDTEMMTRAEDIVTCYDALRHFVEFVERVDKIHIDTLLFKLQGLKDIRTTIRNLAGKQVLDDIELFEVKHLAILAGDVAKLLKQHDLDSVVAIPPLDQVINILDPDGMKIATFYIYDSYCEQLKQLRSQMRQHPDQQDDLILQADALEDSVRADLSERLRPFATAIEQAQLALARTDVLMAKAMQMRAMGLTFPELSLDGMCRYEGIFHPQVQAAVTSHGRKYQPVDIAYGLQPTLITGANMGGKTVVLKTLTLCQLLFQFGFGIPAAQARIDVKDEIYFCIGDEQSVEKGLSSFAAEMKNIDAVIKASRMNKKLLALIDEPARTTNPTEGAALVSALLRVLDGKDMSLVMTTHYDIEPGKAHCLRVKGFENGEMDYRLVEVRDGEVPHEALNIAQNLGIDTEWIETARAMLATQ
ncbi:MAG: DNA mismatch repair protein MutS [Muribaculaceae bacterium]|nr:DNA mismatch repair protein MutS [Muribaculaceae bacterium]